MQTQVQLYTDGACSGNPGPGGWGAILVHGEKEKELSGGERETTNNRMELTAVIRGLQALKRPCRVEIYTDSQYVANAFNKGWVKSWQKSGWKKADKKPVLNPDLWQELLAAMQTHDCTYIWVRGHAGHSYNERCDALAVEQAEKHGGGR